MRCWVLLLVTQLAFPASAEEWEQFLDEDDISGYSRSIPGSRVRELRSVVVVDAPIEVVGAVLRDIEGLKRPGSSCYEARLLERPDRDHYTFYAAYSIPGPFSDRVAVVNVANRNDLERGRVISDLRAVVHPSIELPGDAVVVTDLVAQFVVEILSRTKTGVVNTSRFDPAGSIPAFLANRAARGSLLENAQILRQATRKPEYVSAAATSPDGALVDRLVADRDAMARILANRLADLMGDPRLAARLATEPTILEPFVHGDGRIGSLLLQGWGSAESKRRAIRLLLRQLLAAHSTDGAAVDRFLANPTLYDRILSGQGGDDDVAAFVAGQSFVR